MYQELIAQRKKDFDGVLDFVRGEIGSIRTGRAHGSLVEDIQVEYMESRLRIKELGTITTPEPRVLMIQPWDPNALAAIEKGIKNSDIGLNPVVDGHAVRLVIPPLTEERRKEFIRLLHQKVEEGRVRIRRVREEILKKVQTAVREKEAREDDLRKAKDELQKIIDTLNEQLETLTKKKEQELMS